MPNSFDAELLERFQLEIASKVPHQESSGSSTKFNNATPLIDVTQVFLDGAKKYYGLDLSRKNPVIFCKFDSNIYGGSIKVRPAVSIIEHAIKTGRLRSGQTIFEATSGNFGLALGMLKKLGLNVVVLVSRKLQGGVIEELKNENLQSIQLDVDICPAPGVFVTQNIAVAMAATANLRQQLERIGFNVSLFDNVSSEIQTLMVKQDAISLAKLLAKIYNGFCPEQYDNELNPHVHETVTGPEIDQQLNEYGYSLRDFRIVTTFGTGGTSTGLGRYTYDKYHRRNVHVIFPLSNQDVAGIRTKDKAHGLKFYQSTMYAGEHEVDFEPARKFLKFFVEKGYDIGESTALALYASLQILNYNIGGRLVVIAADGIGKYLHQPDVLPVQPEELIEVKPEQVQTEPDMFDSIIWTHSMFVPKPDGIELVASSLRVQRDKVKIAKATDVQELISTMKVPPRMEQLVKTGKKVLLVCMVGNTSLRVAQLLAEQGLAAQSLAGGIMGLSQANGAGPESLVEIAT
jgi:cysteine synthase/rhodanese-related sulfurtransferase